MAGHSKWANIQHRKNAQDARRGKLFTKLIREITVAARLGGGDPLSNPRLRMAVDKGLAANMTRDTVERAIKRGAGDVEGANVQEIRYEGYGPGGAAVLADCMTDNRNRTVAEVRHAFNRYGGHLGTENSVAYLFARVGVLSYPDGSDEDAIMDAAIEAGAEDVVVHDDGSIDVLTPADAFHLVRDAMVKARLEPAYAEITERAAISVALDEEATGTMVQLIEALEDLDDVQNVYTNADFSEESIAGE